MKVSGKILLGLLAVVVLITIPIWYNFGRPAQPPKVNLDTPEIRALEVKKCIEDTEYMRAKHMQLLSDWKVSVVREGNRIYVAKDGKEYLMCMQETCFACHSNQEEFCNACHEYVSVEPNCWSCHNPK